MSGFQTSKTVYRKDSYKKLVQTMEKSVKVNLPSSSFCQLSQKLNEMEKNTKKYQKEEQKIKEMSQKLQSVSF